MKKFISVSVKVLVWLAFFFICYRIYYFYRTASPSEKIGWTLFYAVLFVIGLLMAKFPALRDRYDAAFEAAIKSSLRFAGWFLAIFYIPNLPYLLLNPSFEVLSPRSQVLILIIWGILLVIATWVLVFEKYRIGFFNWFREHVGTYAPIAYSFSLMWTGIYFFSSLTYILLQRGILHWTVTAGQSIPMSDIGNFYFWHFWDAVPVFKITDTLLWKEPLTYDSSGVGLILLLFKIVVISPIIGSFIWYWKYLGQENKQAKANRRIPKRVPRTYHRKPRASN